MKRSPMRRTAMKRKRRDPAKAKAWRAVKAKLWQRCEGHCEVPGHSETAHDPHHVKKRSQGGGDDLSNLVALSRGCHQATDRAKGRKRLVILPGPGPCRYSFHFFIDELYLGSIGPFTWE